MKKILFMDADGTLLNDDKEVTPKTVAALKAFQDAGNIAVICTGRPITHALPIWKKTGLSAVNFYICSANGAEIYSIEEQRDLFYTGVPIPIMQELFSIAKKYDIHCHTYTDTEIVTSTKGEALDYYCIWENMPVLLTEDVSKVLKREPTKLLAVELHDLVKLEMMRLEMQTRFGNELQLIYSIPVYMEAFSQNAGKEHAIEKLCNYLGISIEDSIAVGDSPNDLGMIRAAGLGVAMKNAHVAVREVADLVTEEDNNHDGLVPLIENLLG